MGVEYLFCFLVIISGHQFVRGLDFVTIDYCGFSNNGLCINKTHLLCNATRPQVTSDEFRSTILNTIKLFRANLRESQNICNLIDFKWNQILEDLAEAAVFQNGFQDYCFENADHKYILYFNLTQINSNSDIASRLNDVMNSEDKPTWLYSAYSTAIGCAINNIQKTMICMTNGIDLTNHEQSLGYKDDCSAKISNLAKANCSLNEDQLNCTIDFICNPLRNFNNSKNENLSFTMKRFILHKLMTQNKNVNWNNDLEYLATQIVTQQLTQNDKCLAMHHFPNISDFHFEGTDRFNDRISNIDSIWHTNNSTQNIGCALYTQTTKQEMWNRIQSEFNTQIYCLHSDIPILVLESSSWAVYLLIIPVIVIICAGLIVFVIKRRTKLNEKKCEAQMEESTNSKDYYDKIDVR